jgi:phosphate transport system protein
MRDLYHDELQALIESMVEMTKLVGAAISQATTALLEADLELAEKVISADRMIDLLTNEVEDRSLDVMARQAPVAGELRATIAGLRVVTDVERMGDLALHIAKVARRRYPASAIPASLRPVITRMGEVSGTIVGKVERLIAEHDLTLADEIERDDDDMDDLHRQLFTAMLSPQWDQPVECAIDVTLCGRYYERFCDHGVSVARRVRFRVTGEPQHREALPRV